MSCWKSFPITRFKDWPVVSAFSGHLLKGVPSPGTNCLLCAIEPLPRGVVETALLHLLISSLIVRQKCIILDIFQTIIWNEDILKYQITWKTRECLLSLPQTSLPGGGNPRLSISSTIPGTEKKKTLKKKNQCVRLSTSCLCRCKETQLCAPATMTSAVSPHRGGLLAFKWSRC